MHPLQQRTHIAATGTQTRKPSQELLLCKRPSSFPSATHHSQFYHQCIKCGICAEYNSQTGAFRSYCPAPREKPTTNAPNAVSAVNTANNASSLFPIGSSLGRRVNTRPRSSGPLRPRRTEDDVPIVIGREGNQVGSRRYILQLEDAVRRSFLSSSIADPKS